MATLGSIAKPALRGGGNPTDAIYQAMATGNQSGLMTPGSLGTNNQINNAFYQQGVANPYYQSHMAQLNRTGAAYQPGGMFYDPKIDGGGGSSPGLGGGINPPPTSAGPPLGSGGTTPGLGGSIAPAPSGNVPAAGGTPTDWSKIDVNQFLDPNVAYRIGMGSTAIQNSAAAKGGLLSGSALKGVSDYANNQAGQAYADAQNAAFQDRNFMRGTYTNDRDYQTALDQWNQNFAQNQHQFDTGAGQWQQQFGQNQHQFDVGANQWQQQFGQNQYQFNTGVDQNDRNFFYNAAQGDRNFNYQSLMDLAHMGQYGTTGNAGLMDSLARYLSANTIASGTAGAQGSLGSSNAISNIISQLLGQYGNNQWMSQLFPQGGP